MRRDKRYDDEGLSTVTSEDQCAVEEAVAAVLDDIPPEKRLHLDRDAHIRFLLKGLGTLSRGFTSLDASKPWICYWILHSLDLMNALPPQEVLERVLDTLLLCQNETGGFGGGFGQLSHLATTYAAVNAIAIIGLQRGFDAIRRQEMLEWMISLKQPDGSFVMHLGGEVDVRGSYCALATAKLLNILTPELRTGVSGFIVNCQTFEGGIGGVPFVEAHGGYTFCGLAAIALLGDIDLLDTPKLLKWASSRQMEFEGGFQGRTNKLVDGCYSLWQGGVFPLLRSSAAVSKTGSGATIDWDFDREALKEYVLTSGQNRKGGLRDKPEKNPDYYHTCYCLSGLSVTEHDFDWNPETQDFVLVEPKEHKPTLVRPTHPVHNICVERVNKIVLHFS